eukprot:5292382-Amphidinium_carterae.2
MVGKSFEWSDGSLSVLIVLLSGPALHRDRALWARGATLPCIGPAFLVLHIGCARYSSKAVAHRVVLIGHLLRPLSKVAVSNSFATAVLHFGKDLVLLQSAWFISPPKFTRLQISKVVAREWNNSNKSKDG